MSSTEMTSSGLGVKTTGYWFDGLKKEKILDFKTNPKSLLRKTCNVS